MKKLEIEKLLKAFNKNERHPVTYDIFVDHAKRYIKAIKEERVICSIGSVSASGMSRTIKFVELAKSKSYVNTTRYSMLNFYQLFDILGYQKVKGSDYFRIHGCGMDMVFNTNYNNIHNLQGLGFITKKTCSILAQQTPNVI